MLFSYTWKTQESHTNLSESAIGQKKKKDRTFSPFGQMPVLHHGEFRLSQSNAILRHLGRVTGRYGRNEHEASLMDMICDSVEDIRSGYLRVIYGDYDGNVGNFVSGIPKSLQYFEDFLAQHHIEYFGFNEFSFADASLYVILETINMRMAPGCHHHLPHLKAWFERCSARPNIVSFMSSGRRPDQFN